MAGLIRLTLAVVAACVLMPSLVVAQPVPAVIKTPLASEGGQIRQFAFDGNLDTFFLSQEKLRASDHFTLVFDRPVLLGSIAVVTGGSGSKKSEILEAGTLEVSPDGLSFTSLASFSGGNVRAQGRGERVVAVRIKSISGQEHPLAIREFTIASDPPVAIFRYPIEIAVDCSDSPEMREWAETAARLCERWYPRINDELKSTGFTPTRQFKIKVTSAYDGVAAASSDEVIASTRFFKEHPDDFGAMIHETVHIVQNYQHPDNPGWLVEGVADYVRFIRFEPGKIGPIRASSARYDGSYRTTAAFLDYVAGRYDQALVRKLNDAMRAGKYTEKIFKELTGKTVEELDNDWRHTLRP
jgi:hypothetical protein